uniref:Uncharacterized protein n=1 Tax=Strigamia maritima TaxID=126957 RepID=T1J1D5_STRMM
MDTEEPFKRGYLHTPPLGKLLKRSWQKKYYAVYQASNLGVERVEVFDSEMLFTRHQSPNKLIPLNDCIKVVQAQGTQKNQNYVFEVICRNQIHQFSANTTQELSEWIAAFQTVAFGSQRRPSQPTPQVSTIQQSKDYDTEENMIYSSMSRPEIYTVQIVESEASKRCNLTGSYQFVVTPLHVSISPINTTSKPAKPLYTWHYRHIRRFSQTKETFSFEAGRKCASGEGIFSLETKEGNAIFQSVGVYLKSYKKQGPSDPNSSTSTLSSNSSTETQKSPQKSPQNLPKNVPAPNDESLYENTVMGATPRPPITKPPRKNVGKTPESTISSDLIGGILDLATDSDVPSKNVGGELLYDVPEDRVDAWKTHGLEEDNIHTESVVSDDVGPLYASVDVTSLPVSKVSTLKRFMSAPEVLAEAKEKVLFRQTSMFGSGNPDGDSYDHLFGRQHAGNADPEHIYKKLEPSVVNKLKLSDAGMEKEGEEGKDVGAGNIEHVLQNNQVYSLVTKGNKMAG